MLWITGGKGLVGKALSLQREAVVTGREVDISDREAVFAFLKSHPEVTEIVNCAAFSNVDASEEKKEEAYRANAVGPEVLGEAARERGAAYVHISTDYVFDGTLRRELTERDPVGPCNTYGETKLEGEQRALALAACVIRTSWVFGPGGKNHLSTLPQRLQTQKEMRLTNDQWSRFTYAPDLAGAILQMLGKKGLYQYANRGVGTKYDFAVAMKEEALALGFPIITESIIAVPSSAFPTPCKRPVYSALNTEKIEPYVSIRPWREALREFLCAQRTVFL